MARVRGRGRSYFSGLRKTSREYLKSKIGMIGLVVIVFFVLMAVFASELTSNNPTLSFNVASPYSIPAWATALPMYHGLATTSDPVPLSPFNSQSELAFWEMTGSDFTTGISTNVPPNSPLPSAILLNTSIISDPRIANNPHPSRLLPYGQVFFSMSRPFEWTTKPPGTFWVTALVDPLTMTNVTRIYINFIITGPGGNFSISSIRTYTLDQQVDLYPSMIGRWHFVNITNGILVGAGFPKYDASINPSDVIFNMTGSYHLTLQVQGVLSGDTGSISMLMTGVRLHIMGSAYGALGTDNYGRDVWSQFVYGARVSLLIGLLSGIGAVGLGALAGLAAGYLGGLWDEVLSRLTDFFLVIPFLPLLIVVIFIISQNSSLYAGIYGWIILLFVILTWPSIGKIIRSQVLTVKERSYVEASRAVGGGTGHIIRRHLLPNVMGLVYSQVALNVSGFILLEAALDFLAVSIHPLTTITWGAMLTYALPDAVSNAGASYVWWWFLPPGIAIAALSLAFVLVGFALDSIFNPRLRAR